MLPAPRNMEVETENSSTILITWDPPPRIGAYTYAIVLFNGTHIIYFNVGSVISQRITGLEHLQTYLVLVVAMSGNEYSASYVIHTVEAGMNILLYNTPPLISVISQFDLLTLVTVFVRAELKCIMAVNGEQSAMTVGASMMQMLANEFIKIAVRFMFLCVFLSGGLRTSWLWFS